MAGPRPSLEDKVQVHGLTGSGEAGGTCGLGEEAGKAGSRLGEGSVMVQF